MDDVWRLGFHLYRLFLSLRMGGEGFWEVEEKSVTEKWQEMKERIRGLVKKKLF